MKLVSEDYLMHYGVKGMKWGVRHDPEPSYRRQRTAANKQYRSEIKSIRSENRNAIRSANQKSKAQRKAAGQKNLQAFKDNYGSREARRQANSDYRSEIKSIRSENRNAIRTANQTAKEQRKAAGQKNLQAFKDIYKNEAKAFAEKTKGLKLTPEQKKTAKKIAIGAAVVAGVALASYGGYKAVQLKNTRDYNKAAVAKFLDANPDIANSVLKGGKPYKNPVERTPKYLSGVVSKGSTISKGKIHNSIKGPTLQTTRSTVTAYAPPNYAGINPPYVSKMLERDAIGAKGRGRIMTKEQKKYYSRMYKDYIRSYKKR